VPTGPSDPARQSAAARKLNPTFTTPLAVALAIRQFVEFPPLAARGIFSSKGLGV